ncbi:UNVERIFIED_CONTAM: hypothetical protein FKN15_034845 [Acipenser sinensis]
MADKSVIVISDDETDTGTESPGANCKNSSVLLLEENSDFGSISDENGSDEMVDAESGLSITYSRKAEVMPHARYDCTSHVFCQSENQTSRPVGTNSDFCEQCYCYICDKLASECQSWITPSFCHCNAHKRSLFWKSWRDKALIGALIAFKFDLLEIDADLRHAESLLMKFDADLTVEHDKFMMGTMSSLAAIYSCSCCCHNQYQTMVNCKRCSSKHEAILIYNYSNVYQLVLEFLEKANGEKPKTFAVVLLGAAQRILLHKQPLGLQRLKDLIPFFMCKHGDFTSAGHHLFHSHDVSCCTACRLTPRQFTMYLKILRTGQVPVGNEPSQSENQTSRPVGTNSDFCEQCYCYICDKLASECQSWITPSFCHCNAHKRSLFWKSWRDKALIGALIAFKFDLLEIDADLRHAESLLMKFDADLTVEHDKFMMGTMSSLAAIYSCSCCCHNQYQTMVNCKRCSSKHEAILIYNYSNVYQLVLEFLEKANGEKPKTFAVVLLGAAQRILLHKQPLGLNVYLWEDSLLVSVLRGQNITGERVVKGKKEVLFESIHMVLARTEKLREQNKQFTMYLKILRTGQVPVGNEPFYSGVWETPTGLVPVKKSDVIKVGLRILNCNAQLYMNPDSWADLIQASCSDSKLARDGSFICVTWKEPEEEFQQRIRETAGLVLKELETKQIIILPKQFYSNHFPDEAMLMLVTQALVQRLIHAHMCTVLNIAMAFRRNMWALKYLFKSLSVRHDVLHAFLDCLIKDLNEKNNTLLTRTLPQSDAEHIGHFIFFLISYEHAVLRPVAHRIVYFLLEHWNDFQNCPWQQNLATLLQNQHSFNPVVLFDAKVEKYCPGNYVDIKRTLEREVRQCQALVIWTDCDREEVCLRCAPQGTLEREVRQCQALVIWTDCDREGENIGFEVIEVCKAVYERGSRLQPITIEMLDGETSPPQLFTEADLISLVEKHGIG